MTEGRAFLMDVYVEGEPVRRQARVEILADALGLDGRELPFESVFWVSRRAGMLLIFARAFTAALKGPGGDLDELARAVERRSDRNLQRRRLLQPLAREVVVCTAGTAVSGRIAKQPIRGLYLAVFTQRGVHLVARDRQHTLRWPVEKAERSAGSGGRTGQEALELKADDAALRLVYLFPEEIRAVIRYANRTPPARPESSKEETDALEMFARSEVAPPIPARLPEFNVSVETIQEASIQASERIPVEEMGGGPGREFFEIHFQELGEIALGPLMLRKSAAAGAKGLRRAVEAMDAGQLREDARAAVSTAADRLYVVYDGELERRLQGRRVGAEAEAALRVSGGEREELRKRMREAVDDLDALFEKVEARQGLLLQRLQALETGPPESEGGAVMEEAAEEWRADLQRLDRAFGATWRDLLDHIATLWSERLVGRLVRAETLPRRLIPEWAQLVLMATATLVVVALIVALLIS